jgi:cell division protein FtsW
VLKTFRFDPVLFISILMLVGFGVVVIYSSSGPFAEGKGLDANFYLVAHIKKVVLGIFVMLVGMSLPKDLLRKVTRPFFFGCLILLVLLLVSGMGITLNGAKRWMNIGGFVFQPSELMKFATILMVALKLEEVKANLDDFKTGFMKPMIIVSVVFGLIILQPNYSMASIIMMISLVMIYVGGCKLKHLGILALLGLPAMVYLAISQSYRLKRVMAFLNPEENVASSYQQLQSLISLGNGGLLGTGLGAGTQKLGYLPMPFTDMIYAMIGEELGLMGTTLVLVLFGLLIYRGIQIAINKFDYFESLVALGLTLSITMNVFLHIGVCISLLPPTGQPLPLISYGGSSLIMNLFAMGILLGLSRSEIKPQTVVQNREAA